MSEPNLGTKRYSAVETCEEAVYLLRRAPSPVLSAYVIGTLPFLLGFLYFWADLSQSAFAAEHREAASLGVALLYLWMVSWHGVFARGLRSELAGEPLEGWFSAVSRRAARMQMSLQPTKFVLLPLAAIALLPFAWVYAFYQNLSYFTAEEGLAAAARRARRQATLWQAQNWALQALLAVVTVVVFLNVAVTMALAPYLLKSLFGMETTFTRSGMSGVLNTTFLAVSASLTYALVSPWMKAVYVLRCFRGESIETGEDLRSELRRALAAALMVLMLAAGGAAWGQEGRRVELDRAIDQVIHRPEFTWRLPRADKPPPAQSNWFVRTTEATLTAIQSGAHRVGVWFNDLMHWLREKLRRRDAQGREREGMPVSTLRILVVALLAVAAAILGWLLWSALARRRQRVVEAAPAAVIAVDLTAEDARADEQPPDYWLDLARACIDRNELRLAARALYLAGLSALAVGGLISLDRTKTNQDYARELRRRAREHAGVLGAFRGSVLVFERSWYGEHAVGREELRELEENLRTLRGVGGPPGI